MAHVCLYVRLIIMSHTGKKVKHIISRSYELQFVFEKEPEYWPRNMIIQTLHRFGMSPSLDSMYEKI
jgi:hypothetical protein